MAATKPARHIPAAIDFSSRTRRVLRYSGAQARMTGGERSAAEGQPPAA